MLKSIRLAYFLICCCFFITTSPPTASASLTPSIQTPSVERRIHINPPGANESRYFYVPFDVPAHAVRISVSYQYDRAIGANTIDIGLFDARSTGTDKDPRGFRGWSGGRRADFFISRDEATPGYLRGEMPAGKWYIILGLYRVAPGGVDVSFKIDIETAQPGSSEAKRITNSPSAGASARSIAEKGSRPSLPVQKDVRGLRWWRGDLHMHTVHSDGDWTIPELISSARSTGLDFIFITDHNTASHHEEIDRLSKGLKVPLVMRSEEITTYGGHTNAWGLPSGTWIDFRSRPGDVARMSRIVAETHRAGAVISINHPFALCGGCSWTYPGAVSKFDAIEIWNGSWDQQDELALKMWDEILQSGRRMTAIASSDSHRSVNPIGQPTTNVAAMALSQPLLLQSIRQGHVYLTDKTGPLVTFRAEVGRDIAGIGDEIQLSTPGTIRFLIATEAVPPDATVSLISNGRVAHSFAAGAAKQPDVTTIKCEQDSYFRVEIRDKAKTVVALTNPIYVRVRR
jgi:hypothetical protein